MTIEQILNAIGDALVPLGRTVHMDEVKQGYEEGDILVHVVSRSVTPLMRNRYQQSVDLDVSLFDEDKADAYDLGEQIFNLIELIYTEDGVLRCSGSPSFQYLDGVIHVLISYTFFCRRPEEPGVRMQTLKTIGGFKNG